MLISKPRDITQTVIAPMGTNPQNNEDTTNRLEIQTALQRWYPQAKEKNVFGSREA